jgi:hypothetical protein
MSKWTLPAYFLALTAGPAAAADVRLDSYRHPENQRMRKRGQSALFEKIWVRVGYPRVHLSVGADTGASRRSS